MAALFLLEANRSLSRVCRATETPPSSAVFSEWYVRSRRYRCRIVRSNGPGHPGLARSRSLRERFLRHATGTPVLKSLWPFRIAYLCSFSQTTASDLVTVVMAATLPRIPLIGKYHRRPAIPAPFLVQATQRRK